MNFIVYSEFEFKRCYRTVNEPHMLITVNSNDLNIPVSSHCVGTLNVDFDDIEDINLAENFFDNNIANKILDFVNNNIKKCNLIIVESHDGNARSGAIASALSKIINHEDDALFYYRTPNMLAYITILDTYFTNENAPNKWPFIFFRRQDNFKAILPSNIFKVWDYKVRNREKGV